MERKRDIMPAPPHTTPGIHRQNHQRRSSHIANQAQRLAEPPTRDSGYTHQPEHRTNKRHRQGTRHKIRRGLRHPHLQGGGNAKGHPTGPRKKPYYAKGTPVFAAIPDSFVPDPARTLSRAQQDSLRRLAAQYRVITHPRSPTTVTPRQPPRNGTNPQSTERISVAAL